MERKKFSAGLIALVAGIALSVGSAFAQTGYLQGDPSNGKLIPYYEASGSLATIIGLENVSSKESGVTSASNYIFVHVVVFDVTSTEVFNTNMCLSPYDFGFIILQQSPATAAQLTEVGAKVVVASVSGDFIPSTGYVTLAVVGKSTSCTAAVTSASADSLASWSIVQDVGTGFFGTEIPTATASVHATTGAIDCSGGNATACGGLIPSGNTVIARYDINPDVSSVTQIFVWLGSNGTLVGTSFVRNVSAFLQCEHELQISTTVSLPYEINVVDPSKLGGVGQCVQAKQYRGVLRFDLPATGFLWSHVSQAGSNYRMNFLGYNLDQNAFIP